jgi:hypothetical protein
MKSLFYSIVFVVFLFLHGITWGYEVGTHEEISKMALRLSNLVTSPNVLKALDLQPSIEAQKFPNTKGQPQNIIDLIGFGARNEDLETWTRALNHFYDPAYDRALTYIKVLGTKTPDWAMENPEVFEVTVDTLKPAPQHYSFIDANDYLFDAITALEKSERDKNFGLFFQTLGHLMHLIQDMAQPEHVRNDLTNCVKA